MNLPKRKPKRHQSTALQGGVLIVALVLAQPLFAQTSTPSLCNRENAAETIRAQINLSRTIDNRVHRITVLVRAADLWWFLDAEKAATTFSEALDVAVQHEQEKYEESKAKQEAMLFIEQPDQRFVVIGAVAKHDPALAKKLTARIVQHDTPAEMSASYASERDNDLTGQWLLMTATQMVAVDPAAASELARVSLRYPLSFMLARFLYQLAAVNQRAADTLYGDALEIYAHRPLREFLYLPTYPFAYRSSVETPVNAGYLDIPADFKFNRSLQRRFVQTLLRRAQQTPAVSLDQADNYGGLPAAANIARVLSRVEPEVRLLFPDLLPQLVETREQLRVSLSRQTRQKLRPSEGAPPGYWSYTQQLKRAEQPGYEPQQTIIEAVLASTKDDDLDDVLRTVERIRGAKLRSLVRDWLYFRRAEQALYSEKRLDLVETLAAKIEMVELRAYLKTEIAREWLNIPETQSHALELLEQVVMEVSRAPFTISSIRTLFTVSHYYLRRDRDRSLAILKLAIEATNKMARPDFGNHALEKRVTVPGYSRGIEFSLPGTNPDVALRELAREDFDLALSLAMTFTDPYQRALTTLSVAEACLVNPANPEISLTPCRASKSSKEISGFAGFSR